MNHSHAAAWLVWVGSVLLILSTTRNPWYVGLLLACILTVKAVIPHRNPILPFSVWQFGLMVVTVSLIFNGLAVRFGQTVLLTIPSAIPLLGGTITLEAVTYGALNGLALTGMVAAFMVFNQAVAVRHLIRLVPRVFFPVAIIVSIAITFVPLTLSHYRDIRHAQAVRGHRLRGLRDWLPLVMPLLIGGLERAFQLAEAMTARGFASTPAASHTTISHLTLLMGLILLMTGWLLRLMWGYAISGWLMLGGGLALIIGVLWWMGRQTPHTRYRPQRWLAHDWLMTLAASVAGLAFIVPWPGLDRTSIFFYPYPSVEWPSFQPLFGLSILALLMPAWFAWQASDSNGTPS